MPLSILEKYYPVGSLAHELLLKHSRDVAAKAVALAQRHPELEIDEEFVYEAAMLHDIGIFMTDAPSIGCYGEYPYVCHGYLGAELLRREGLPRHALVAERHTGAGISIKQIEQKKLPLPLRDMRPVSLEEQLICYADKFYSKSKPNREKSVERILESMERWGKGSLTRFEAWHELFG